MLESRMRRGVLVGALAEHAMSGHFTKSSSQLAPSF
jgi:hypothetical protein